MVPPVNAAQNQMLPHRVHPSPDSVMSECVFEVFKHLRRAQRGHHLAGDKDSGIQDTTTRGCLPWKDDNLNAISFY